jgi:hypothetical protein
MDTLKVVYECTKVASAILQVLDFRPQAVGKDIDRLERQIRLNLLLEFVAELYDRNLTDVISVKEWLEAKADMLRPPGAGPKRHFLRGSCSVLD